MVSVENLEERWHKNYEVDPKAKLDTTIKVALHFEDGSYMAYIGTEDGYEDRKVITNSRDIIELFKNFIENDF